MCKLNVIFQENEWLMLIPVTRLWLNSTSLFWWLTRTQLWFDSFEPEFKSKFESRFMSRSRVTALHSAHLQLLFEIELLSIRCVFIRFFVYHQIFMKLNPRKNIVIIFLSFFDDDVQKFKHQTTGTDTFHFRMSQNNIDICLTVSKTCISWYSFLIVAYYKQIFSSGGRPHLSIRMRRKGANG